MSDTLNWAKKDLIVHSINSMSDRSAQSIASAKNAIAVGNAKQDIKSVSGAMARVGARVDSQNNKKIFVYCYNPKVPYSSNFGDAYYVNTGYANCNGLAYPVYINGNYAQFDLSGVSIRGTWAVMIQKIPNSEVWGVNVLFPSPTTVDSSDVMVWKDKDGNTVNLDADSWVIGSFILDIGTGTSNSITGLFMQSEAMTPTSFLKNRFMQVLNEAEGSDTDDFTSWANAMGCDGVFKRLSAISCAGTVVCSILSSARSAVSFSVSTPITSQVLSLIWSVSFRKPKCSKRFLRSSCSKPRSAAGRSGTT